MGQASGHVGSQVKDTLDRKDNSLIRFLETPVAVSFTESESELKNLKFEIPSQHFNCPSTSVVGNHA